MDSASKATEPSHQYSNGVEEKLIPHDLPTEPTLSTDSKKMAEKSETLVTKEERIAEAKELFGRGSRNYCMKQYSDAADDLSACCAIYSDLYGPSAEQCGVPYLLYAKSLIALGKDENNLIVPGEEEEEGDGEDEEGEGEEGEGEEGEGGEGEGEEAEGDNEEKCAEDNEAEKDKEGQEKPDSEAKTTENGESVKDNEAASSSKVQPDEPQPGPSTSNGSEQQEESTEPTEDEKGGGNLEVAWEILELAVQIFEQQGEKALENLSECYSELAGISLENSHFSVAINDYRKALAVHSKVDKSDSRLVAEIYYKMGLCHLMINEFEDSIKSLREACTELDKVVEQEKGKEQNDETEATIKDLEETKQEIIEKIAEVEETKKTSIEEVKRELSKIIVQGQSSNGATSSTANGTASSSKSSEKPTDISHLIKRKKPDTSTTEVEGSPAKKTAVETEKPSE